MCSQVLQPEERTNEGSQKVEKGASTLTPIEALDALMAAVAGVVAHASACWMSKAERDVHNEAVQQAAKAYAIAELEEMPCTQDSRCDRCRRIAELEAK